MILTCPRCKSENIKMNGFNKANRQKYKCKDCKRSFFNDEYTNYLKKLKRKQEKEKEKVEVIEDRNIATYSPNKILQEITTDDLEEKLLSVIYENIGMSPQWAKLALQVLEDLSPKYKDHKGKSFTPQDYKKFLDDSKSTNIDSLLELARKCTNEKLKQ